MKRNILFALLGLFSLTTINAQEKFNGLAAGPYKKLVIREAMVIPGHGGPPVAHMILSSKKIRLQT